VTIFRQPGDYEAFIALLLEAARRFGVSLLAFCIMPNHWHLVLVAQEPGAVSAYMGWLTGTHVKRYHRLYGLAGTGHLYQGRYTDVLVQGDVHLLIVMRYVEANPLRARLVDRAEAWPWSSLGAPLTIREQLMVDAPVPRPSNWVDWVNGCEADLEEIRSSIRRGRPFGTPSWTTETAARHGLEFTLHTRGRRRSKEIPTEGGAAGAGVSQGSGPGRRAPSEGVIMLPDGATAAETGACPLPAWRGFDGTVVWTGYGSSTTASGFLKLPSASTRSAAR
jgi:putative transposase